MRTVPTNLVRVIKPAPLRLALLRGTPKSLEVKNGTTVVTYWLYPVALGVWRLELRRQARVSFTVHPKSLTCSCGRAGCVHLRAVVALLRAGKLNAEA